MSIFKNQELAERIDYYGKEKATKGGAGALIRVCWKQHHTCMSGNDR